MMKKTIVIACLASFTLGVNANTISSSTRISVLHGKVRTETFKVYGNCGMCESTIEGSLKNVKGIKSVDWNKETKMITVNFDSEKISLLKIKKKITSVGYDTEEFRATQKAYNSLPGCCQYERPKSK